MSARLVYTSGPDGESADRRGDERTAADAVGAPSGPVHVRVERAGRKGKTVTVAAPLALPRAAARSLVRELKRELGSGGAVRELERPGLVAVEIQGEHVSRLAAVLRRRGIDARAGGSGG